MKKKIVVGTAAALVLVAGAFLVYSGDLRFLGLRAPFGRPAGWFGGFGDNNAFFVRAASELGLGVGASRGEVLEALGLPENATFDDVINALREKGITIRRDRIGEENG